MNLGCVLRPWIRMLLEQQEFCLPAGSCGDEQLPFHSVNRPLTVAGSSRTHAATCICHGTHRGYFQTNQHVLRDYNDIVVTGAWSGYRIHIFEATDLADPSTLSVTFLLCSCDIGVSRQT